MFGDQEGKFFLVFQKRYGVHNVILQPSFFRGFLMGLKRKIEPWHPCGTWYLSNAWNFGHDMVPKRILIGLWRDPGSFMAYEIFPEYNGVWFHTLCTAYITRVNLITAELRHINKSLEFPEPCWPNYLTRCKYHSICGRWEERIFKTIAKVQVSKHYNV